MCKNYLDIMDSICEPNLDNKNRTHMYIYRFLNSSNLLVFFKSLLANLIYQYRKLTRKYKLKCLVISLFHNSQILLNNIIKHIQLCADF